MYLDPAVVLIWCALLCHFHVTPWGAPVRCLPKFVPGQHSWFYAKSSVRALTQARILQSIVGFSQVAESMEAGAAQLPAPPAIQEKPPIQTPGPPAVSQQPPVTLERLPPPQNQETHPQSQTFVSQSLVHIPQARAVHFPGPTVAEPSTLPPAGGQPQVGVVSGVGYARLQGSAVIRRKARLLVQYTAMYNVLLWVLELSLWQGGHSRFI